MIAGKYPEHWVDPVHEEDGGCDAHGVRPQVGIDILRSELDALTFKNGVAVAKDDVTGTELVPELVRTARDEEIAYFIKRGVYKVVPRSHQLETGGKAKYQNKTEEDKARYQAKNGIGTSGRQENKEAKAKE